MNQQKVFQQAIATLVVLFLSGCTGAPAPPAEQPASDTATPAATSLAPTSDEAALLATLNAAAQTPNPQLPTPARPTATPCPSPAPTSPQAQPYETLVQLFDYDPHAPLDIQEAGSAYATDGVTVQDLSYASPKGGRVPAYLVVPDGTGPFAGILLQHGLPSNRSDLLPFAKDLAKTGAVVLLVDAPFNRPERLLHTTQEVTFTPQDRDEQIQLIVDLRRGVDLLTSRPEVDANRLAYVGISYGAAMGGLLAGVEQRIKAYVLAVGDGGLVTHFTGPDDQDGPLQRLPQAQQACWLAAMEPIEPIHYVGHAAPAALFFQAARRDQLVPEADAIRFQQAGSEPKQIKWYDADHGLNEEAIRDLVAWLQTQIGIDANKFVMPD